MRDEAAIRPFVREDAAAVADLLAPIAPADYPLNAAALVHTVDALGGEDAAHWVAETGGDIVGWAQAGLHLSAPGRDVQRLWVAVREDRRPRGLGSRLFRTAEAWALARAPR